MCEAQIRFNQMNYPKLAPIRLKNGHKFDFSDDKLDEILDFDAYEIQ